MRFAELESMLKGRGGVAIAVAQAQGSELFSALGEAETKGLARFVLVGDIEKSRRAADDVGLERPEYIAAGSDEEAARLAVEVVREGRADVLMKGKLSTDLLLRAVLEEKALLSQGRLLSHVLVLESPAGRMLIVTDGGMNIHPDVEQKQKILSSAVAVMNSIGVDLPKAAILSATEKESCKMPETLDAAELSRRWERGDLPGCIVDGPLALDLALSQSACARKGYDGRIQGDADILLTHDIASGNCLGKSLIYAAGYSAGGVIVGADRPIVLLSRSDSAGEKYRSILLAIALTAPVEKQ